MVDVRCCGVLAVAAGVVQEAFAEGGHVSGSLQMSGENDQRSTRRSYLVRPMIQIVGCLDSQGASAENESANGNDAIQAAHAPVPAWPAVAAERNNLAQH